MTTTNKNQHASSIGNKDLIVSPALKSAKIVPLNIRYDAAPQESPVKVKEETRVIRRYSFDDNGGGYLGL